MYLYTNSLLLMFSYCTPELEEFLFFFSANYKQKNIWAGTWDKISLCCRFMVYIGG